MVATEHSLGDLSVEYLDVTGSFFSRPMVLRGLLWELKPPAQKEQRQLSCLGELSLASNSGWISAFVATL